MVAVALSFLALLMAAEPASAPGWRPALNAVQETNVVARCVAHSDPVKAAAVLDLPLVAAEQAAAASALLDRASGCAASGRTLEITTLFLVGGMAEELLLTKYANVSPDVIRLIQPTVEPRTAEEDLALCFAEKWPAETRAIIATSAGSPGEALAVGKILPQIGSCVPAGLTMRLNAATVRALAAAALYRVSSQVEAGLLKLGRK